jgi:hypothetical protein
MDDNTTIRTSVLHRKKKIPPPETGKGLLPRKGIVVTTNRETPQTRHFMTAIPAIC